MAPGLLDWGPEKGRGEGLFAAEPREAGGGGGAGPAGPAQRRQYLRAAVVVGGAAWLGTQLSVGLSLLEGRLGGSRRELAAAALPDPRDKGSQHLLAELGGDKELLGVWLANHPEIVTDSLAREHQAELLREQDEKMKAVAKVLQERGIPEQDSRYLAYFEFAEKEDMFVSTENVLRLKGSQFASRAVNDLLPEQSPRLGYQTCALVGNAGTLKKNRFGAAIDVHDVVVRLNQAPTEGYETMTGTKTTYRILNNKWSVVYYEDNVANIEMGTKNLAKYLLKLEPRNTTLVVSRANQFIFEGLAKHQRRRRPDMRTMYFNPKMQQSARRGLHHFAKVYNETTPHIQQIRNLDDISPSTGLLALYFLLQACASTTVYGISLFSSHTFTELKAKKLTYHYFRKWIDNEKQIAHPHHDFALEGLLIKRLSDIGYITLCGGVGVEHKDNTCGVDGGGGSGQR